MFHEFGGETRAPANGEPVPVNRARQNALAVAAPEGTAPIGVFYGLCCWDRTPALVVNRSLTRGKAKHQGNDDDSGNARVDHGLTGPQRSARAALRSTTTAAAFPLSMQQRCPHLAPPFAALAFGFASLLSSPNHVVCVWKTGSAIYRRLATFGFSGAWAEPNYSRVRRRPQIKTNKFY